MFYFPTDFTIFPVIFYLRKPVQWFIGHYIALVLSCHGDLRHQPTKSHLRIMHHCLGDSVKIEILIDFCTFLEVKENEALIIK